MTGPETEVMAPNARLLAWLAEHDIDHEVRAHPPTVTARETAAAEGIDPRRFAKTLGVATSDGRRALIVLDATDPLDFVRASHVLDAEHVRLLTEDELRELAPDCDTGTVPPIGELYGVRVYADLAVRDDPEISFHAGSHRHTVHVDRSAWERAVGVIYGNLAHEDPTIPAWARS
jgi:Ala-tRNA(Pro) deacylase